MRHITRLFLTTVTIGLVAVRVGAQGQDSTPGERNLLVMGELMAGIYSNANQALFDARRGLAENNQHVKQEIEIKRLDDPLTFSMTGAIGESALNYRLTLEKGAVPEETSMAVMTKNNGAWENVDDCIINFRRRAEHYDGKAVGAGCDGLAFSNVQLSRSELWLQTDMMDEPYWYERARIFHCYADLPGVSGGRDMPFERYDNITLHDKGATHWFETRGAEKRTIGLTLQAITWHVLNENNGNFNRNSLVLYASERMPDGSVKAHPYTFTEPSAERIGYNLRWMLVNCAMVKRDEAKPEM